MASSSSTFSYAQAAKGHSILPNGTPELSSLKVEGSSDRADTESDLVQSMTSTEPGSKTSPDLNGSLNSLAIDGRYAQEDTMPSQTVAEANVASVNASHNDQSVPNSHNFSQGTSSTSLSTGQVGQPLKEDDVFTTNNESDSTWDKISQGSQVGMTSDKFEVDAEDTKLSTWEHVQSPQLKEAPIPSVNIWQKRALDMQARAKEQKPSSSLGSRDRKQGHSAEATKENSKRKGENGVFTGKEIVSKSQSAEGPSTQKGNRTPEAQKGSAIMAPPPPSDALSWPTPNIAKDGDKRKVYDRGEKTEKEKTPSRPHGREKWEKVDYVPTAVFNTPLPTPRRGGRLGGRGGRDNGARGGSHPNGREGTEDRSASGPNAATSGSNNTPPNERVKGDMGPPRSGPLDPKQRRSFSAGPPSSREQARGIDGSQDKRDEAGRKQSWTRPFRENRRISVSMQTDSSQRSAYQFGSEHTRRSSIIGDQHQGFDGPGEQTNPRFPIDRRGEGYVRSQDYGRDTAGHVIPRERREGRPERGRGGFRGKPSQGHTNFGSNSSQPSNGQPYGTSKFQAHSDQRHGSQPHAPPFVNGREPRHGRASSRSQSIPNAQGYGGRYMNGAPVHPGPHHPPPLHIGVANMYPYQPDHPAPMSAVQFHPYMEHVQLQGMVQMQMEYYFSLNNLCKDMFLRKNMDSQGFVFLHVLQQFNRIKQLTEDSEIVKYVCVKSPMIEIRTGQDGLDRVRKAEDWKQWVLNTEDRVPSAQTDGPAKLGSPHFETAPPPPQMHFYGPYEYQRGSVPGNPLSPREFFPANGTANELPSQDGPVPPGHVSEPQSIQTPLSAAVPDFKPSYQAFNSAVYESIENSVDLAGTFSDDKIDNLSIIVRRPKIPELRAENVSEASHEPASNGHPTLGNTTISNGNSVVEDWIYSNANVIETSNNEGRSPQFKASDLRMKSTDISWDSSDARVFPPNCDFLTSPIEWQKDGKRNSKTGPEDITQESYVAFRHKALQLRDQLPEGHCHRDMAILYEFWSHFLMRNLNMTMYEEFHRFAIEDFTERSSDIGLKYLTSFYYEWLLGPNVIPDRLAKDFVDIAYTDLDKSDRPAFNALRAIWRNGALNLKNRMKIDGITNEQLRADLER